MLNLFIRLLISVFRSRRTLILENTALRHQIEVLQRNSTRPALRWRDRAFWDVLSCIWPEWRRSLFIVQPETVIRWHKQGFRLYWRWKSRYRWPGRPPVSREVRELIRQISMANPLWGAPRIHGELLKLGIDVGQATVSKYMVKPEHRPSQSWQTLLTNHAKDIVSIDFFTAPTAAWTGQQIAEAFPWETAPRYLIRDRDGIYGFDFTRRVSSMGIKQIRTVRRSPWQNPYVERVIGSIRRECLDHVIIFDERHLKRVLKEYLGYYHRSRTHLGLDKDCPELRGVELPEIGPVKSEPVLVGLHHRYFRHAA